MRKEIISMRRTLVLLVSLVLVIALALAIPVLAASIYESYNTGDDAEGSIYDSFYRAQTFTPSLAHTIASVKLMLRREGVGPGTITVSIRATDVSGHPTGGDLCSGTIAGSSLTTSLSGAWYEITLGSGYSLSAGTQYAIVVGASGGNVGNRARWRMDTSSPTYGGGNAELSNTYGSTWSSLSWDMMFEEWGDPPGAGEAVGWETYPVSKVRVLLPWIALLTAIAASASLLILRRRRTHS